MKLGKNTTTFKGEQFSKLVISKEKRGFGKRGNTIYQ